MFNSMKRTFFSKVLMVAIAVATIGFVSCKDYDDDINNLQEQINKAALTDNVTALEAQLKTVSENAASALSTAQQALTTANAAAPASSAATAEALAEVKGIAEKAAQDVTAAIQQANDAAAAAAAAQNAANDAQTAANGAQTTANNAQSTADAAKAAAIAAQQAADKAIADAAAAAADAAAARAAAEGAASAADVEALKKQLESQLKTIGDLQTQLSTALALSEKVEALQKSVDEIAANADAAAVAAAVADANARVEAYKASVDALWSAVTNVSLYVAGRNQVHGNMPIMFLNTKEVGTFKFPLDEKVADAQVEFLGREKVSYVDTIVIRVSPTNAQLTSDMISLINSQGVEINKELVKVEVFPYEDVLTRAVSSNGLWKVAFQLKDNYTKEEFNAVSEYNGKDVLFAVAVNNTLDQEGGEGRRVISEYDLYLQEGSIEHAWNFYVDDNNVRNIHNRWSYADDGTQTYWPNDVKKNKVELVWMDGIEKAVSEGEVSEDNSNDRYDRYNRSVDYRQNMPIYVVEKGKPFTIDYRRMIDADEDFSTKPIRAFYVTLDENFAVESAPSELNAWRSYTYENVGFTKYDGTIVPAHLFKGNVGQITIKDMNNVRGDIIGFRVYAVNYDGTVVDPDGRAFYVLVGDVITDTELPEALTVIAHQNAGDTAVIDVPAGTFLAEANYWTTPEWTKNNPYVTLSTSANASFYKPEAETVNTYALRGDGAKTTSYYTTDFFEFSYFDGTDWTTVPSEETVKVKVKLNHAQNMLDDEVYSVKFRCQKRTGSAVETLQTVTIKVKKVLPTDVPELIVKVGQESNIKPLKVSMKPVINSPYTFPVSYGSIWNLGYADYVTYGQDIKPFDYADIFTNLQTPLYPYVDKMNYKFEIPESDLKAEGEYVSTFAKYGRMDLAKNRNDWTAIVPNTYSTPYAYNDRIEDGKAAKGVTVHYTYPNLSLTELNQKPVWNDVNVSEDYSSKFTVQYFCALQMGRIDKTTEAQWPRVINATYQQKVAANAKTAADKAVTQAKTDSTNAAKATPLDQAALDAAILALHNAQDAAKNAAANKTAADAELTAAKAEFNNLFTVKYEEDYHRISLNALYFKQTDVPYLGLTAKTYAERAELPVEAYIGSSVTYNYFEGETAKTNTTPGLISGNYLAVTEVKLSNEDYYTALLDGGDIVLRKTRSTEEPALTTDQTFKLSVTLQDVFGHQHKKEFDVKMLKPVLHARGL